MGKLLQYWKNAGSHNSSSTKEEQLSGELLYDTGWNMESELSGSVFLVA